MATSRPVENLLGLAVLSYLTQRPMHAYELHRQLRDNDAASTFRLSYGALYSVVRQLLRAELITESGTGQSGKRPQHTIYELTEAGRTELSDWLRELIAEPRHEYPAFAAALSLIVVVPPDDAHELLTTRISGITRQLEELGAQRDRAAADGVHPVFLIEDDYREALLSAELDFVRQLLDQIAHDDWSSPWREHHTDARVEEKG